MTPIDLSKPAEDPVWVVGGVLEVGTVTMIAADSGAAKSLLAQEMAVSVARGRAGCWLGPITLPGPVVYIDGENHERLVAGRLRALGAAPSDPIHYETDGLTVLQWNAEPCLHTRRLCDLSAAMGARLIVLDTVSATLGCDANVGKEVVDTYRRNLRPLARAGAGAAVVILHHERKADSKNGRGDARQAVMGSRHWGTQADGQIALLADPAGVREREIGDGDVERRFSVTAAQVKGRDGQHWEREITVHSTGPKDAPASKLWITRS